jgi:hypothetical protein
MFRKVPELVLPRPASPPVADVHKQASLSCIQMKQKDIGSHPLQPSSSRSSIPCAGVLMHFMIIRAIVGVTPGSHPIVAKELSSSIRWNFLHASFRQRCQKKMVGSRFGELEDADRLLLEAKLYPSNVNSPFSSFRLA